MQNQNIDTPVIMLTANALSGMKEMYLEKGFTDYISKPIDGKKLERKIEKYLPKDKVLGQNETQNKHKEDVNSKIKEQSLANLKKVVSDINMELALQYCAGSTEFYIQCLKDYCNNGRKEVIEQCYEAKDWKRYKVEVHALKSTSRTLGLERLGNIAEKMQSAAQAEDIQYIDENHEGMIKELEHVSTAISNCL